LGVIRAAQAITAAGTALRVGGGTTPAVCADLQALAALRILFGATTLGIFTRIAILKTRGAALRRMLLSLLPSMRLMRVRVLLAGRGIVRRH